jgi:SAM-dependent methyltransferase
MTADLMRPQVRALADLEGLLALSDDVCTALRDVCANVGYSEATLELTSSVPRDVDGFATPLLRQALLRDQVDGTSHTYGAGVLALLFACEDDVPESVARDTLGEGLTDALLAGGFLAAGADDGYLCANFQFLPIGGVWVLGDHVKSGPASVMPPGPTTGELVGVMPRDIQGSVLDVGCGPGTMALVAARRGARWATGTDINPRAIQMANFNARLNEVQNVTFVVGDLMEPVRGERFDLVVAQPPFIIQPPDTPTIVFVHGGPTGEDITLRLAAALPDVLAPNGRALMLAETPTRPSEPIHQRYRREIGDRPVDVIVLATPARSATAQAMTYATLEAPAGTPAYLAAVARYAAHLEANEIRLVTHVLVVMRARDPRSAAAGHRFAATIPIKNVRLGNGEAIDLLIRSLDMTAVDDDTLATAKLHASRFATWIEARESPNLSEEPTRSVRFAEGCFASDVDSLSASAFRLAGLVDAAESVEAAAREHARTAEMDASEARTQVLRFAREALGRGLLEPGS